MLYSSIYNKLSLIIDDLLPEKLLLRQLVAFRKQQIHDQSPYRLGLYIGLLKEPVHEGDLLLVGVQLQHLHVQTPQAGQLLDDGLDSLAADFGDAPENLLADLLQHDRQQQPVLLVVEVQAANELHLLALAYVQDLVDDLVGHHVQELARLLVTLELQHPEARRPRLVRQPLHGLQHGGCAAFGVLGELEDDVDVAALAVLGPQAVGGELLQVQGLDPVAKHHEV